MNDKVVGCRLCGLWIHKDCAQMDDGLYKYLVEEYASRGSIEWKCDSCKITAKKFLADVITMRKGFDELKAAHNSQEEEIKHLKSRIDTLEDIDKKRKEGDAKIQEKISTAIFTEQKERDSRKDNIVIHNLEEAGVDVISAEERKAADINKVQELIHHIGSGVDAQQEIIFLTRLGSKKDEGDVDKPRPLLIGFKSSKAKESVMIKASQGQLAGYHG